MEDSHFLREMRQVRLSIEFRRDDYRAAGKARDASTCIRCIGDLNDLELLVKKDMKKKPAPRGRG